MRDAGQSDYKNRHRIYDLSTLAPFYNRMGLFSSECHGGARWHVGVMNRRESPFEEIDILRQQMPNVLLADPYTRDKSFRIQTVSEECHRICGFQG